MTATMKALMKSAAPGAKLVDAPLPAPKEGEVLIKVKAASICGTDVHIYDWDSWAQGAIKPPIIFGHEFTGEVIETGRGVRVLRPGDLISAESHIPCDACYQCKNGMMHICDHLKIIGLDVNGGFAEVVAIPEICALKHPIAMPPDVATVLEPLGNAVHAVMAEPVRGKDVAVFGCGPTGLFTIQVAKAVGARQIIALDINPHRMQMAKEMGADHIWNGAEANIVSRILEQTGGYGVDIVYEMSGSQQAINQGLRSLKKGGVFIAFGIPSKPVELNIADDLILTGRRMIGIVGRLMFQTWEQMYELLAAGRVHPEKVVTHAFKLAQFEEAFKTMKSKDIKCGKVVMYP